jgi:hypothetical protein
VAQFSRPKKAQFKKTVDNSRFYERGICLTLSRGAYNSSQALSEYMDARFELLPEKHKNNGRYSLRIKLNMCLPALLFFVVVFCRITNATVPDTTIKEIYTKGDYNALTKLLEDDISNLKKTQFKVEERSFFDLYKKYLLLAYVQAWKLSDFDRSIQTYQDLTKLRSSFLKDLKSDGFEKLFMVDFENLFIAELYEKIKNFSKAKAYYRKFLLQLTNLKEKGTDDSLFTIADELTKLTKYQIDSLDNDNGKNMLLNKLNLTSLMIHKTVPFLMPHFVTIAKFETPLIMKSDLSGYIKQSTKNFTSMVVGYILVLEAAKDTVDEPCERAMHAYISKYPDGYLTLSLRYLFYEYYKRSNQKQKAEVLLQEIQSTARKRGMTLFVGPFSGQVLDKQTGKPIKGASLFVCLENQKIEVKNFELIKPLLVHTDKKGTYSSIPITLFPTTLTRSLELATIIIVYQPGYQAYINRERKQDIKANNFKKKDNIILLNRIPPNFNHKKHYERITGALSEMGEIHTIPPIDYNASLKGDTRMAWDKFVDKALLSVPKEEFLRRVEWENRRQ